MAHPPTRPTKHPYMMAPLLPVAAAAPLAAVTMPRLPVSEVSLLLGAGVAPPSTSSPPPSLPSSSLTTAAVGDGVNPRSRASEPDEMALLEGLSVSATLGAVVVATVSVAAAGFAVGLAVRAVSVAPTSGAVRE